jgi:isoamylase
MDRTQRGNNNAYCQDNEISWLDWTGYAKQDRRRFDDFVTRLVALRRNYKILCCSTFLHGTVEPAPGIPDIAWFDENGGAIPPEAWNDAQQRTLILRRAMADGEGNVTILTLLMNPTEADRRFRLPPPVGPGRILLDTACCELNERCFDGAQLSVRAHAAVLVAATLEKGAP